MTAKSKKCTRPYRDTLQHSLGHLRLLFFFHSPKQPLSTAAIERGHYVLVGIIYEDTCVVEVVPFFSPLVPRSALQEPLFRHEGLLCWGDGETMGDYEGLNVMVLLGFTLCFAMKAQNCSQTLKKKQNWRNEERREACKEMWMYPQGVRHVYCLEVILWVGSTAISFFIIVRFSLPSYNVARPRITHKCLIDRFLWESLLPLHFCIWCFLFFLVFRSFCLSSLLHSFNFIFFLLPACIEQGVTAEKKKVLTYGIWEVWLFLEL